MTTPVPILRKRSARAAGRSVASYSELRRMFKSASIVRASRTAILDARRVVERITDGVVSACVDVAIGSNRKTLTTRCLAMALDGMRDKNPVTLVPLKEQEDVEALREELKKLRKKAADSTDPETKLLLEKLVQTKKEHLDAYLAKLEQWRLH